MKQLRCLPHLLYLLFIVWACSSDDSNFGDPGSNQNPPPTTGGDEPDIGDGAVNRGFAPCEGGSADIYSCDGYDLLLQINPAAFGAGRANDIWGWTDTTTSREYALLGLDNGTAFIDITDTENPVYLGKMLTATTESIWRDLKVYQDFVYVVAESAMHGMQVFDLKRLRNVPNPPVVFEADARYTLIGNCHNVVINEEMGFAYPVGTARNDAFNGGVHFVDIQNPTAPNGVGGYADDGYTHDAQVVTYNGPDTDYTGREIFVGSNEDQIVIVDITDKASPSRIETLTYPNIGYTHQGWFTEDHRFFILGDELDETDFGFNSRTLVFDFADLDNPQLHMTYLGPTGAIDHNGYVLGNQFFLANYTAGVRILDISQIENEVITEEAFFDTFPQSNVAQFNGVWSVYPYFQSGKIILSDTNSGLFVIQSSN
ncbi:choice-of-anchor B family protein [Flagellimonas meridianipacifica]|uniref:Choice-of-anchor B domain-containing protein n=1 Tax=Flagellimonas meridianipacifica TaxID=1080225 RepID=A0A2T0MHI6_9FLAO|nr:choice-of-anchor B family protein [Allomuricauda pacifica]PRX57040.1 choice-of-anchor B domain-containing protein [Allomuricauda pacifica]